MKAAETVNAGSAGSSVEPSSMFSGLYGKLPIEQGDRVDEWQRIQSAQALDAVDSESGSNHSPNLRFALSPSSRGLVTGALDESGPGRITAQCRRNLRFRFDASFRRRMILVSRASELALQTGYFRERLFRGADGRIVWMLCPVRIFLFNRLACSGIDFTRLEFLHCNAVFHRADIYA